MNRTKTILLLGVILVFAAALRLYGVGWDQGHFFHPDERFLAMVVNDLSLPETFSEYLDPVRSRLNPYNSKFTFFVYGTLPINLNKYVVSLFGRTDFESIGTFGRYLSAIFDLASLLLVYLTVRLWERHYSVSPRTKFLAALLYAIAVLPIQQSHFFTVDSFLNLFMLSSFYFALRSFFSHKVLHASIAAICFGFAMGTKVSAVYILPLVMLLVVLDRHSLSFVTIKARLLGSLAVVVLFGLLAYLSLRVADPRFFASGDFLNPEINPKFLSNVRELAGYANFGDGLPSPPSVQWINVPPVTFALKNIAVFGVGLPYFCLCILGVFALYRRRARETVLVAGWMLCFFLWQSSQFVKTMRYFYCLYPFMAILAGVGISYLVDLIRQRRYQMWGMGGAIALSMAWPYSFMQIYTRPHSRVSASQWIYDHVPANSRLAQIHWDDFLPVPLKAVSRQYDISELPVFAPDDDSKWAVMNAELAKADYIVFSSNRGYGSIMPLPQKYPRMSPFFKQLFEGTTTFQLVADITSFPTFDVGWFAFPFDDQSAEEAFSVYDHPRITIFRKVDSN